MKIIKYNKKYDDNIIALMARAKYAIGKSKPSINQDVLNIQVNYIDKGDMFFIGLDDNENVIAMLGYNIIDKKSAILHRFYVKPELKRQGLGTQILSHVENDLIKRGVECSLVHLGDFEHYGSSYNFYIKNGYIFYEERRLKKVLLKNHNN